MINLKNTFKYLITSLLLLIIILTSAYTYRIYDKSNYIDTINNDIDLIKEETFLFKAKRNNLNKIKINIDYQNNYVDNQEVLITITDKDKIIKEEKVSLNKLQTYKNIQISFNKIKDSIDKDYQISIKPLEDTIECKLISTEIMYYQNYHNILYISLILILIIVTFILLKFLFNDKNIKIENWYLILSILVYGAYIVVFPLFTAHDEFYHWGRSYEISEGHLVSDINDNHAKTELPLGVIKIYDKNFLDIKYETTVGTRGVKNIESEKGMFDMRTVSVYSPVQYIPQTIGISIAKIFTDRPLIMAYFGRIMNAIISILLMYLSIRLIPFGKKILFTIAFIPISIEGFTSLSADAITISLSFLLLSYILYLKFNNNIKVLNKKHYICLLIMSVLLALCKIVYLPLILLLFLLPKSKFKNKKHKLLFILSIIGISVLANIVWLLIASTYLSLYESTGSQLSTILKHPINFIQVFLYTILSENRLYIYTMLGYNIGWGEVVHIYSIIPFIFMLLLLINTFADKDINNSINKKETIIILTIVLLIIGLIFASLYIQFTPPGFATILGVQGRYFIPFLPLLMIITSKINLEYKGKLNLDVITIVTCLLLNISVIITLFERYI